MSPGDPTTWAWYTWAMHAWGVYYISTFFGFFFRIHRLEKRADEGDREAVQAYNRSIRGFPGSMFAKMLGKRRIELGPASYQ